MTQGVALGWILPTLSGSKTHDALAFFEEIERGTGVYVVLYDQGKPSEICFAGYSYD